MQKSIVNSQIVKLEWTYENIQIHMKQKGRTEKQSQVTNNKIKT